MEWKYNIRLIPTQERVVVYLNCVCGLEFIPKQGHAYICLSVYVMLVTRLYMGLSPTSKTL
jgi:hypothetical protein